MTKVYFKPEGKEQHEGVTLYDKETLLDGLLRSGYAIPYGCKGGVCQSCLLQSPEGKNIPAAAQSGLKAAQVEQGLFLGCACVPEENFRAQAVDVLGQTTTCRVVDVLDLNERIFRLRLSGDIAFRAGQYVTLWRDASTARSYSIASVQGHDAFLEFHIKHLPGGAFSAWARNTLTTGDTLQVQGPLGQCFYATMPLHTPLFLCGIGTGLAPLYGIARDALLSGHSGEIALMLGAESAESFYLVPELLTLAQNFPNFEVNFVALNAAKSAVPPTHLIEGNLYQTVGDRIGDFSGKTVYLCGGESFVRKMKKQCFLAGAAMRNIHSDAFLAFN